MKCGLFWPRCIYSTTSTCTLSSLYKYFISSLLRNGIENWFTSEVIQNPAKYLMKGKLNTYMCYISTIICSILNLLWRVKWVLVIMHISNLQADHFSIVWISTKMYSFIEERFLILMLSGMLFTKTWTRFIRFVLCNFWLILWRGRPHCHSFS